MFLQALGERRIKGASGLSLLASLKTLCEVKGKETLHARTCKSLYTRRLAGGGGRNLTMVCFVSLSIL